VEIREVDEYEYQRVIPESYVVFNSVRFNSINSLKCESVKYILFIERVPRLGIVCGIRDNTLQSPFSAPYGGFSAVKPQTRLRYYAEAAECLNEYASTAGFNSIGITLPPYFYDEAHIAKQISGLNLSGYQNSWVDIDLLLDLREPNPDYENILSHEGRKNLNKARRNELYLHQGQNYTGLEKAYEIIQRNRLEKGRPLRMDIHELLKTASVVPIDWFLISKGNDWIASAIVMHINQSIVQVVYWGAIREFEEYRPINYLAYQLYQFYVTQGLRYIDVGPSSEKGFPDYGLVDFKESLGCRISIKHRLDKAFC
jgi:hypothetical protein